MSRVPEDLVSVPSSPSPLSPPRAPHHHEGSITPQAPAPECPICLEGPSTPPNALDAFFPCCAAFAHLGCIQQCAHRHGHCPNCRQNVAYLRHDPAFVARCEDAGVRMTPLAADGAETVFAAVSHYALRTFSRADAPEPEEPRHIRASCCARLAGPAMGFVELPDRSMRWSPVPHRGHAGIHSWTPAWICMRCQAELPAASVSMPLPRPPCHCCHAFMIWEVDLRLETERWVCSRCPASGPARALDLRPSPAASPVQAPAAEPLSVFPAAVAGPPTPSPTASDERGAVTPPDMPAAALDVPVGQTPGTVTGMPHSARAASHIDGTAVQRRPPSPLLPAAPPANRTLFDYTQASPPDLPLRVSTYSCIYVPLLLDAAGLLALEARQQWRQHPAFAPWWSAAISALLSRPFLPVHQVLAAATHFYASHGSTSYEVLMRLHRWQARLGAAQVTSLATLVREIIQPSDGYYIPGPLQEMLLALLLGEGEAASLARRINALGDPRPEQDRPRSPPQPRPRLRLVWGDQGPGQCDPHVLPVADNESDANAHTAEPEAINLDAPPARESQANSLAGAESILPATALREEDQHGATAPTQVDAQAGPIPAATVPDAAV